MNSSSGFAAYVIREFSEFQGTSRYHFLAPGTKRIAERAVRVFDAFMAAQFPVVVVVQPEHLVAYALHRVLGELENEDPRAGSVQLTTFMVGEAAPLIHLLRSQGRANFTLGEFRTCPEYVEYMATIKYVCGEVFNPCHSRPLWRQDEDRLRSCLTLDTASKRDAAMLVLMARMGFRPASIAKIRLDIHVQVSHDSVRLTVPDVKRSNLMDIEVVLVGDDAGVLRRWIDHRRVIFPDSQLLFLTSMGTAVTCDSITRMLDRLSVAAGYGAGFFTAQSCRVGYATKIAAKTFCEGGTEQTVRDRLYTTRRWDLASQAVNMYINPNVRNFFSEGTGLSWEQFEELDPCELHDLTRLRPLQKRPLTWFCHSEERLRRICFGLGLDYPTEGELNKRQLVCRRLIGQALFERCLYFQNFVSSCTELRPFDQCLLSDIVGCLLEEEVFDIGRYMISPYREELRDAVVVRTYSSEAGLTTVKAQKVHTYPLVDRRQAQRIVAFLQKRKDRKTHLGRLPSGEMVLLKVRARESHVVEAQLPLFDLDLHFPEAVPSSPPVDRPSAPSGSAYGTELTPRDDEPEPRTPARSSSFVHWGRTPSTTASSVRRSPAGSCE
jgi:hypothetical protein